ncbi:hypothetical protein Nepgr_015826 [Nepenthes gracilis]|uniref:Uncharacterized protein n=1 Tax=Nepenthes gracilis TaxID=150966 RepID=A0AAD3SLL4_NEPGR|nr:hypothetical protein Nepgr_015826 [Nepenthes gracilis]
MEMKMLSCVLSHDGMLPEGGSLVDERRCRLVVMWRCGAIAVVYPLRFCGVLRLCRMVYFVCGIPWPLVD